MSHTINRGVDPFDEFGYTSRHRLADYSTSLLEANLETLAAYTPNYRYLVMTVNKRRQK